MKDLPNRELQPAPQTELESVREQIAGASVESKARDVLAELDSIFNELVELRFEGIDDQYARIPAAAQRSHRSAPARRRRLGAQAHGARFDVFDELSAKLDRRLKEPALRVAPFDPEAVFVAARLDELSGRRREAIRR